MPNIGVFFSGNRTQCWIVAHLELTDEEAARYKDIPVVYNEEVVSRPFFPSASSLPLHAFDSLYYIVFYPSSRLTYLSLPLCGTTVAGLPLRTPSRPRPINRYFSLDNQAVRRVPRVHALLAHPALQTSTSLQIQTQVRQQQQRTYPQRTNQCVGAEVAFGPSDGYSS